MEVALEVGIGEIDERPDVLEALVAVLHEHGQRGADARAEQHAAAGRRRETCRPAELARSLGGDGPLGIDSRVTRGAARGTGTADVPAEADDAEHPPRDRQDEDPETPRTAS